LLESGLASPSTIFANNGLDFDTEVKKIARDKKLLAEAMQTGVEPDETGEE
jgi:hypothetical protein